MASYKELKKIVNNYITVCNKAEASVFVCNHCVHIYVADARYHDKDSPHKCFVCRFWYCKKHVIYIQHDWEDLYICNKCVDTRCYYCSGLLRTTNQCVRHNVINECCTECHKKQRGCIICTIDKAQKCICGISLCANCTTTCVKCQKILCDECKIYCEQCNSHVCNKCSILCLKCGFKLCISCPNKITGFCGECMEYSGLKVKLPILLNVRLPPAILELLFILI